MPATPLLVEALRGSAVESLHHGSLAIMDADGGVHTALGDIDRPVFPRSAVKLLQALPLVASGAAEALALTHEELALACASHGGEPEHVRTAQAMLAKAGLDAGCLECGAHWPMQESAALALASAGQQPNTLHNNCSGKHAGFACLAHRLADQRELRGFFSGYVNAEHAVMQEVSAALQSSTGCDLRSAPMGIDGCSIPTFALPLRALALAFARVATGQGLAPAHQQAARRLRGAIAKAPQMVAGSGHFDTLVMQALGERVCCKVGAEAVYCAALPERGLGVALKVDDGTSARAAEVVMAAVIEALLPLDDAPAALLHSLSQPVLKNWRGTVVGGLRPSALLQQALAH